LSFFRASVFAVSALHLTSINDDHRTNILRPLHNCRERSKFELRSGPVLEHSECRRFKIQ